MKKFLLLSLFVASLLADELMFLPYEAQKAQKELIAWIDRAQNSIDVAMYSFTKRELAKHLRNAAKRGVKIRVLLDYEQNMQDRFSQIGYLAKYRNITVYTIRGKYAKHGEFYGKMHIKLAIIDSKRLVFGSANWSNSAFKRNYELIYFMEDYAKAKKAKKYFEAMVRKAQEY